VSSRKEVVQWFFKAHLKVFAGFVCAALIVSLAAGGILFHRYRTGPDYAFKNLRAALNEGDKAKLATMIDFRSLSEDLSQAVFAVYPQTVADETRRAEMQDEAQRLVLKALATGKDTKSDVVLPRKLFAPVPVVPEDVIAQFVAGMQLEQTPDGAQIRSRFTHNGLQKDFPLRLVMERRQGGWLVTRLYNAQEVVSLYKEAVDAILAEDEANLADKNDKIISRMRAHFDSSQCLASANLMGDRQEAMLVVKVTAKNTDATTLHNVNLLCDVRADNGTPVYSRQLNVVQRVYGGEEFANTWTIVLDADSEEAARLLRAGRLSCTVEPQVMSVGAGEILYQRKD
jgi:hypothetical protein